MGPDPSALALSGPAQPCHADPQDPGGSRGRPKTSLFAGGTHCLQTLPADTLPADQGDGKSTPRRAPARGPPRRRLAMAPGLETTRAQKGHFCSSADWTCSHSRDPHRAHTGRRITRLCLRAHCRFCVQLCMSGPELVWVDLEGSPAESARVSPVATGICLLSLARGLGS